MNIFVTDPSPRVSAQSLPDKHIVKMPLETCQMAQSSTPNTTGTGNLSTRKMENPTGLLVDSNTTLVQCGKKLKSYENFAWMLSLGFEMCWEYTKRYGKQHTCEKTLNEAQCVSSTTTLR